MAGIVSNLRIIKKKSRRTQALLEILGMRIGQYQNIRPPGMRPCESHEERRDHYLRAFASRGLARPAYLMNAGMASGHIA